MVRCGGRRRLRHAHVALAFILAKVGGAIVFQPAAQQTCLRLNTPGPGSSTLQARSKKKGTWGWKLTNGEVRGGGLPSQTGFITSSHHQAAAPVPAEVCPEMRPALQLQPSDLKLSPNILVTMQQVCP